MRLELHSGHSASIVEARGDLVTILSEVASPPGSTLVLRCAKVAQPYQLKVRSCRRGREEQGFLIVGRWVNLSRSQRAALEDVAQE